MHSNDEIIAIQIMTQEEIDFYRQEKSKFDQLLERFCWNEEHLFNEQKTLMQCPLDQNHRFPFGSKHLQNCQLVKEGFSKDYLREKSECEQEDRLLNLSAIVFPPSRLSEIVQRPIPITNNIPLNVEQMTVLFTPSERSLIAQTVHNEALRLGLVPTTRSSTTAVHSIQSQVEVNLPNQLNKLAELRDRKRRRTKYVTRTARKSFYDTARELINTEMELLEQQNNISTNKIDHKRKKHKHRSSRSDSRKHHRHSKRRRKS